MIRAARQYIIPIVVLIALTLIAFWPVLGNGFVNWGDRADLVNNPHFRGLAPGNLVWMFTTNQMGHYQPLSWITFAIDFMFWGMNPRGYHLTSLLLHAGCAVVVFFLIQELLDLTMPVVARRSRNAMLWAAFVGAALFAVHPLRVEPVAWATERRGTLFALFLLLSVLWYLRYARSRPIDPNDASGQILEGLNRRYWLAWGLFALSLLAKEFGFTLPFVLLVLDVYPLKRFSFAGSSQQLIKSAKWLLVEKIPFFVLTAIWTWLAIQSSVLSGVAKSASDYTMPQRIAQCFYGLRLYLEKTVWPVALSPLYPIPSHLNPFDQRYIVSAVIVVAFTAALILLRKRWPGALTAWVMTLIIVGPVLGLVQTGPQIAADRYTYLPAVGLSALIAGGLFAFWSRQDRMRIKIALGIVAAGVSVALASLAWRQASTWHDSETLWRQALAVDDTNVLAMNNLGVQLSEAQRWDEAAAKLERAMGVDPNYLDARNNLGLVRANQGRLSEAIAIWKSTLEINPRNADAKSYLERAGLQQGR